MKIPQELIDEFSGGNGAIFVGAGLSMGAGLPSWGKLINVLATELPDFPKGSNYLDVAQYYVNQHGARRLISRLRDELDTTHIQPTVVHEALVQLGVSPIFTTNFDNLIEKSFIKASVRFDKVVNEIDPNFWKMDRVQLVKLHGDLDNPDLIVVTSDDYERYLYERPAIVRLLTADLPRKTTLFLGYSANDDDIRAIMTLVKNEGGGFARKAFSVMFNAHPLNVQDLERRGIKVINFENVPTEKINEALAEWLTELGHTIQRHRPSALKPSARARSKLPSEPYKFLHWFGADDAAIFHGRDYEIEKLSSLILSHKLTILYGESGTGKTSLLKAGVLHRLLDENCLINYMRPLTNPFKELSESLKNNLGIAAPTPSDIPELLQRHLPPEKTLVMVIDQFEEFFIRQGPEVRREFIRLLVEILKKPDLNLRFLFSLRSDYLDRLDELEDAMGHDPLKYRMRLHNLGPANASAAILEPARDFKISLEQALLDKLVSDLEQGGIAPAQLQIVCFVLWQNWIAQGGPPSGLTMELYKQIGTTQDILAEYLKNVIRELEKEGPRDELGITLDSNRAGEAARAILKSMVTSERTKIAISGKEITQGEIVSRLRILPSQVDALLLYLQNHRVIRHLPDTEYYELVHEVMIPQIWEWITEEERRILDIQDLLVRAVNDYQKFQTLLSAELLALITEQSANLSPDENTLELLLRSSIVYNFLPRTWVEKMKNNHAVDVLAKMLMSDRKIWYPQIAQALGYTKSVKAVRYLDDLLREENRDIQRAAASAMVMLGLDNVVPPLYRAIMREHTFLRCAPLLDALEMIHSDESAAMLMLIAREHPETKVRSRSTNAIARLGKKDALRLLTQQLRSDDAEISSNAMRVVENLWQEKPDDVLAFYYNAGVEEQLSILDGLRKIRSNKVLDVFDAAIQHSDPRIRVALVKGLASLKDERSIPGLLVGMHDPDVSVRREAITGLKQQGGETVVDILVQAARDPDSAIREHALKTLTEIDSSRLPEVLRSVIEDENPAIRLQALAGLIKIGDPDLHRYLTISLKDVNVDIRSRAVEGLVTLNPPDLVEQLLDLVQNEADGQVSQSVIAHLMHSEDSRINPVFVQLLNDPDVNVRQAAALALIERDASDAIDQLIEIVDRGDEEFRNKVKKKIRTWTLQNPVHIMLALRLGNFRLKRAAAESTGADSNPRVIEQLMEEAASSAPQVRGAVASALIRFCYSTQANLQTSRQEQRASVVHTLLGMLVDTDPSIQKNVAFGLLQDENPGVRQKALVVLESIKGAAAVAPYVDMLRDDAPTVRKEAIDGLKRLKDLHPVDVLVNSLKDAKAQVRRNSIINLGLRRDPRSMDLFFTALKDEDAGVRRSAVIALGELKDKRCVEPLIGMLMDENAEVRYSTVIALGQLKDERSMEPLLALLKDENAEVRHSTVIVLGQLKNESTVIPLIDMLKDDNAEVRRSTVIILGQRKDERFAEYLVASSKDLDANVRRSAIIGLAELKDVRFIDLFIGALEDADSRVRRSSVTALGQLQDIRALEPLGRLLKDHEPGVRKSTVIALGQIKDDNSLELFMAALKDEVPDVRRSAAIALGASKNPRCTEALIEALNDNDPEVRRSVVIALGSLGDPRAAESLYRKLEDPSLSNELLQTLKFILRRVFHYRFDNAPANTPTEPGSEDATSSPPRSSEPLPVLTGMAIASISSDIKLKRRTAEDLNAYSRDPDVWSTLHTMLSDTDVIVRRWAAFGLVRADHEAAKTALLGLVQDHDLIVRRLAAYAETDPSKGPESFVIDVLYECEVDELDWFAWLFQYLNDDSTMDQLEIQLQDDDPERKRRTVKAIGRTRNPRGVSLLLKVFENDKSNVELKKYIVASLGEIDHETAMDALIQILKFDPSGTIQRRAATALGKYRNERAVSALVSALNYADSAMTKRIAASLAQNKS